MGKQRKTWSIEEKLSIVLEVMQSQESIAAIAKRNRVNDQQIYKWKAAFIEGGKQGSVNHETTPIGKWEATIEVLKE